MTDPASPLLTLPDADWRHDAGLLRLITLLGGPQETRVVGGAVRDTLAGLPVSDIDMATRLLPAQVTERLDISGVKWVAPGLAHGTVTAIIDARPYEITTLRRDVSTDGRRATVAFTDDWREDAARRDFTINALYADPVSGALFDSVGGCEDLSAGRVRFIGDAAARIDEDHLRILRWFRFLARFGGAVPDAETLAIISASAAKLRGLSRERVSDEVMRVMALADPETTVALMEKSGVLAQIVPEALPGAHHRLAGLVGNERLANRRADPALRLIALLPVDPAQAESVASRLKLPNRLRKRIAIARGPALHGSPHERAYHLGVEGAVDRMLLGPAALAGEIAEIADWAVPRLPIGGGDIIALDIKPGPDVARFLKLIENQWIAAGFPARADTLAIAKATIGQ